jgi:hypothetical protein
MLRIPLIVLALLSVAGTACATTADRDKPERPSLAQSYVWYDGDQPRQVWLDPGLIAEFDAPSKAKQGSAVRKALPNASEVRTSQRGLRLWRVDDDSVRAARSVRSAQPRAKVSPVLREAPSADAPMRALPGGVVVHLVPGWSERHAKDWLESQQLEVVRKLDFGRNVFLVHSEPGLEALELANALREKDPVVAAMPDWWEQVEPR